jgi:hypothetical protein
MESWMTTILLTRYNVLVLNLTGNDEEDSVYLRNIDDEEQ